MFQLIQCEHVFDIDEPKCKHDIITAVKERLLHDFIENKWMLDLTRLQAKRGPGLNKLRKYRLVKENYGSEYYINCGKLAFRYRRALATIRCGVAPLQIEVGRYDHGKYVPEAERVCKICNSGIEDEFHILFKCNIYGDIQCDLTKTASKINVHYNLSDDVTKFRILMSEEMILTTAKACKSILDRRKLYLYM